MNTDAFPGQGPIVSARRDMPIMFGPSPVAGDEEGYSVHGAVLSFLTERDAVARLLPPGIEVSAVPTVSISYYRSSGLDWMGGRGYNIVSVYVSAVYRRNGQSLEAPFSLVIWESDCAPIIAGREYMGAPKLYGQIPDADVGAGDFGFECNEYGSRLVTASLTGMRPVSPEHLARSRDAGRNVVRMHWKYIPAPAGGADADYPVAMVVSSYYNQIWKGEGNLEFGLPTRTAAPYSARIVEVLAELPIVKMYPATAVVASPVTLHRSRTTRLDTCPDLTVFERPWP